MSEITKLYENAGIEKEVIKGCYDYYSKLGIDIWKENDCAGKNCDTCKKDKSIKRYPPFTAEKQIELIKWLGKLDGKLEITCTYNKEKFIFNFYFNRKTDKNPDPKYPYSNFLNADIEILIASIINDIWQDLTEEEKQQVKGILECVST